MVLVVPVEAYLLLDVVSALLAFAIAAFFLQANRLLRGEGYGVLALAFAALGLGAATVALSVFDLLPDSPVIDAVRVAALFLSALLIFLNYALRRTAVPGGTLRTAAVALSVVAGVYVVLYFVVPPRASLPDPTAYLPALRLLEAFLLGVASYLVALEVRGTRFSDHQVPIAFLCLALGRYSTALFSFEGLLEDRLFIAYVWRLAGLALLVRVAWPLRRWWTAPA